MTDIVIAGGGLAAVRTAQALRDGGFFGSLVVLSDESEAPYDRPPLSKGFLTGAVSETGIKLPMPDGIDLRLGAPAAGLDSATRRVRLADGSIVPYHRLVVATGARPMTPPALAGHPATHVLRNLNDARRLCVALDCARNVAIVGGGLIGLEIAAAAVARGANVTVIEAAHAPLAPVLGAVLGKLIQSWHERKGVVFRCDVSAMAIEGGVGPCGLHLSDGSVLSIDMLVVGIGTVANAEWLAAGGLTLGRGLVVDDIGRTSDSHVFGVGDVTCRMVNGIARPSRQWTATTEQARRTAKAILGDVSQPRLIDDHYFWSDQHGVRLQYAGTLVPDARLHFVVGGPAAEKFVVLTIAEDRVCAVFSLGLPRDFLIHSMALRRGKLVAVPG